MPGVTGAFLVFCDIKFLTNLCMQFAQHEDFGVYPRQQVGTS